MACSAICGTLALALSTLAVRSEAALAPRASVAPVSLSALGSIGSFTPVTANKRLASAYAQAAIGARSQRFRFTPSVGSMGGRRSITIVVRAPDLGLATGAKSAPSSTLGLGPVAYNLGTARGLTRFAAESTAARELAEPLVPASALVLPRGFSIERPKRLSTNVALENQARIAAAQALADDNGYAVNVASSYRLTRNLDVTAGVRYKGRQYRLGPITDDAQDSQAVYIGTSFKF